MDEAQNSNPVQTSEAGSCVKKAKEKPPRKILRDLSDEEYDAIFKAVLERYPPVSSQELHKEQEAEEKDDFETIIENDEDLSSHYVDKFLASSSQKEETYSEAGSDVPTITAMERKSLPAANEGRNTSSQNNEASSPAVQQKKKFRKEKDKTKNIVKTKNMNNPQSYKSPAQASQLKNIVGKSSSSKKQRMKEREIEKTGTWVQCDRTSCMKWRYLGDVHDPSELPDHWTCSMNQNKACGSCDAAEEEWDESEHIFTKYTEGSVVWARVPGYPYWPAMVEIDPDYNTFFTCSESTSNSLNIVTRYHVVFFDDKVSRAWVQVSHIKPFSKNAQPGSVVVKGHNYKKTIGRAQEKAKSAFRLPIKERLEAYSFAHRYRGKWGEDPELDPGPSKGKSKLPKIREKRKRPKMVIDNFAFEEEEEEDIEDVEEIIRSAESVLDDFLSNHSQNSGLWSTDSSPPKKKPKFKEKKEENEVKKTKKKTNMKGDTTEKKRKAEKIAKKAENSLTNQQKEEKSGKNADQTVEKMETEMNISDTNDDSNTGYESAKTTVDSNENIAEGQRENCDVLSKDPADIKTGEQNKGVTEGESVDPNGNVAAENKEAVVGLQGAADVKQKLSDKEVRLSDERSQETEITTIACAEKIMETSSDMAGSRNATTNASSTDVLTDETTKPKIDSKKANTQIGKIKKAQQESESNKESSTNKENIDAKNGTPAKKKSKKRKAQDEKTSSKITPAKSSEHAPAPAKTPKKRTPKKPSEPKPTVKKPNFDAKKNTNCKENKTVEKKEFSSKAEEATKENEISTENCDLSNQSKEDSGRKTSGFKAPNATASTELKKKPTFAAPKKTLGVRAGKKNPISKQPTPEATSLNSDIFTMELSQNGETKEETNDEEPSAMSVLSNKLKKKKRKPDLSTESEEEDVNATEKKPKPVLKSESAKYETKSEATFPDLGKRSCTNETNIKRDASETNTPRVSSKLEDRATENVTTCKENSSEGNLTDEKVQLSENVNGIGINKDNDESNMENSSQDEKTNQDDGASCSGLSSQGSPSFELDIDAKPDQVEPSSGKPTADTIAVTEIAVTVTQQNDEDSDFDFEE